MTLEEIEQAMRDEFDAGRATAAELQAALDRAIGRTTYREEYAKLKRDRLILKAAAWSIKDSIPLLANVYGYSEPTTRKIVEGSAGADVTAEGQRLFDEMTVADRAARLKELLSRTPT